MGRRILLAAALALVSLSGSAQARPYLISQIEDDPLSARAFEIVRAAYGRIGMEVQVEPLPNERGIVSADAGDTDGDTIRMAGIEGRYPNLVRVPEPVLNYETIAFTSGLEFKVKGWESLRPYSLCVIRGMKLAEKGSEGMHRELVSGSELVMRMLAAGHCQVGILGEAVWLEVDRLGTGPFRALEPPVEIVPVYHYVHRRHAELAPRLAEALKAMRRDGTIDSILAADRAAIQAARARRSIRN
jgi:polar amino acid transport system substrate-binding protein